MDDRWDCPKCGANNEDWRNWCRGCTTTQDAARMANAGGGLSTSTMTMTRPVATAALPRTRRRRRWPKVLAIVVVALAAIGVAGVVFLKQTDPAAGRDRSALLDAMPTNGTFGANFFVSDVQSFARTHAGLRMASDVQQGAGCDEFNTLTTSHGTAGVTEEVTDSVTQTGSLSLMAFAYDTEASAANAYALESGPAFRQCLQGGLNAKSAPQSMQLSDTPVALTAPTVGDKATAYHLDMTVSEAGSPLTVVVPTEIVVIQSRRVLTMIVAIGRPNQPFPDDSVAAATTFMASGVAKLS